MRKAPWEPSDFFEEGQPPYCLTLSLKPNTSVLFTKPDSPPPWTGGDYILKQIDVAALNPLGRKASEIFASLHQSWERHGDELASSYQNDLREQGQIPEDLPYTVEGTLNRRYSGDNSLPATRYYSVCHSSDGNDSGTMVRELRSYYSPLSSGYIEISELNYQTHTITKRFSGGEANNAYSGILISIHQISKCLYPWLSQIGKVPDPVTIELPAVVETNSFDRVLDLRIPQCAAWFCRNLTRLEWDVGGLAFRLKETLDKFPHLLPSLLVQTHGGGEGATRIAGQWLRSLGAEALIFPSARSNSSVAVLDERVVDWYGWNLVDYRNAGPTNWLTFDITTDWVRYLTPEVNQPKSRIYEDVEIAAVDRGRRTGSWHVRNLEEVGTTLRLGEIAMYLYERVMPEFVKTRRDILLRFLMGDKSPATFSNNASVLFKALVGDQDLRLVVLDRAGRKEGGLYGSLDLPTAFRRMDAKFS